MDNTILIVCETRGKHIDLLVPKDITADQLIDVVNSKLRSITKMNRFIRTDNPPRLLYGDVSIGDFGLHSGSVLYL